MYTKGEWIIRKAQGSHDIGVMGGTRFFPVASIWLRYDESEANANLIAAAPELYQTLKALGKNDSVLDAVIGVTLAGLVRKALAKVEGK